MRPISGAGLNQNNFSIILKEASLPQLSLYLIRSSLIYFVAGFSIGMLLLWQKGAYISAEIWKLLPLHLELLTFGWIIQLVMGVAFWILPRFSRSPQRGNEALVWFAFVSLNIGVLLVGFQNLLPLSAIWGLIGRMLEFLAVLAFATNAWRRIKPFAE